MRQLSLAGQRWRDGWVAGGVVLLVLAGGPLPVRGQCTTVEAAEFARVQPVAGVVEKIALAGVTTDHIELALTLVLTATRDATVRQISFEKLRLNDLPFYAAPVTERFQLAAGQRVPLPHPLELTVYYRDREAGRPLVVLLAESRIRIEGTAYLKVELGPLTKIFLFMRRARVPVTFRQEIPLELPGGELMRAAALKVVAEAGAALARVGAAVESGLARTSRWRGQLWRDYAPTLLFAYLRLTLRNKRGGRLRLECTGAGFRISPARFILSKELIEPWKFDPEIAATIKRERLRLDPASYDLWVWPANARLRTADSELDPTTAFRLSQRQIRLVRKPPDDRQKVWVPQPPHRPQKVELHRRTTPANLALFEFVELADAGKVVVATPDTETNTATWERLAVFRFPGGAGAEQARPDLVFLPAVRGGSEIRLGAPVDASAWGMPLIAPAGVVGVVQNETTGLVLKEAFRRLKLKWNVTVEAPPAPRRR
ncbi:MAG: hypothetical protein ACE5MH_04175 [Terriglobia bacterium]